MKPKTIDPTRKTEVLNDLIDTLEDILTKGWPTHDRSIHGSDLEPLMDTSRAILMAWRGFEPIMPKVAPQ